MFDIEKERYMGSLGLSGGSAKELKKAPFGTAL